jgi:ABC-type multidrug transport system fused ATPase/permease subunit
MKTWLNFIGVSRFKLAVLFGLMMFNSLLDMVGVGAVIPLVTVIISPSLLKIYGVLSPVNTLIQAFPIPPIFTVSAAIVFIFLCKTIVSLCTLYVSASLIYSVRTQLTTRLFMLYVDVPYVIYLQRNAVDMIYKCSQEVGTFAQNVVQPATIFFTEILVLTGIVGLLLWFDPLVTVSAFSLMFLGGFGYVWFSRKRLHLFGNRQSQAFNEQHKELDQFFLTFKTVRVMQKNSYFIKRLFSWLNLYEHSAIRTYLLHSSPKLIYELMFALGLVGFCMASVFLKWTGQHAVLAMALFAAAVFRLLPAFNRITLAYSTIRTHFYSYHSLSKEIGYLETHKEDVQSHRELQFNRTIELKHVSFSYPNVKQPVINDVSLTIRKGQKVGIVGKSGAGKTTLVDIILGILSPTSGNVLIDNSSNRVVMGYVPQRITLLDDSLRRNVAFGCVDEDIEDAKVWEALRKAHLDEMVRSMPQGLDTLLGDNGLKISGGQAQRVGIARALYPNPSILIFDEATSSLDRETERQISYNILDLGQDKTLIIIAHRLSTIKECDTLFLMENGHLAAEGTYEELIEKSEWFRTVA